MYTLFYSVLSSRDIFTYIVTHVHLSCTISYLRFWQYISTKHLPHMTLYQNIVQPLVLITNTSLLRDATNERKIDHCDTLETPIRY